MREWEKGAASPIPCNKYERFKEKLADISGKYKERNVMLFVLGVATGYRMQDLVCLTIGQLREALLNGEFIIQEQKQYKQWEKALEKYPKRKKPEKREHKIWSNLEKNLRAYCKGKQRSDYAFPSNKGNGNEHISQKAFSEVLKRCGEEIGLENISGHSLRKTFATRIYYKTGKDLEEVRNALNHKSIEETKRYLGIKKLMLNNSAKIADEGI